MNFSTTTPSNVGIEPQWLMNFLKRLDYQQIPLHSAIIMKNNQICMETYYAPYTKESLHRMFSITKTFVAMTIGLLCEEGKLTLDDHIVDYFPEKLPKDGAYPYTARLTIKDMLIMRTCHNETTFKAKGVTDWVGSFFTTPPNHMPGTNFSYDTGSTHVLGALVEKLSGMKILDYLRSKGLDELGFSKNAYILTDPNGVSMGGSGMCATSRDILLMMMLLVNDGTLNGKQYLPKDFVQEAKQKHSRKKVTKPSNKKNQNKQKKEKQNGKLDKSYFLHMENKKELFQAFGKFCKRMLKGVLPKHCYMEATIGTGDPAITGYILAATGAIKMKFAKGLHITGDFTQKIIKDVIVEIKGRILLAYLLYAVMRLLFVKPVRNIIMVLWKGYR